MHRILFSQLLQLLVSIFITLSTIHPSTSQLHQCTSPAKVNAGYWLPSSSHYSPLSNISSTLYTHLYYYSLPVDGATSAVTLPPPDQLSLLTAFSATVKAANPSLKTLLSIATDDHQTNASNSAFSAMAADPNLRAAFINSTIKLAETNAFDGLDLAWQFPSAPSDMANLAILLKEWRVSVNEAHYSSAPLLLTATVYFSDHLFDGPSDNLDYPIDAISENLDWISALCFGYHKNSEVTAYDAALYDKTSHLSTSYGIRSWLDAGIPPCKLVMGIPLYGRSWYLKNKVKNGPGAQVVAAGQRQKLSNQTGEMAYFEIKKQLEEADSPLTYDNQSVSSYFNNGGLWISFDSQEVVEDKVEFALRNGLLGYFLSPISFDDSSHTISSLASTVWQRYNASGEGKYGFNVAPSPSGVNPQDSAPNQSADLSDSAHRRHPALLTVQLHFYFPLFLLFYLTAI